jgi:hypothetical protein
MGSIRSAVAAAVLLLAFGRSADAASFVKVIGARTRTNTLNSSITISVPSSGVAAGNSILVTLHVGSLGGAVSCSDPLNGSYNTDITSPTSGVGIAIASKHNAAALAFGDVITCTYPIFSGASSISAYEFSGLETSNTLDQTAQDGASTTGSASSGLTAATAQANELVFGFFWVPNPAPTQTFAPATSGGSPLENPYNPLYVPLTAGGTQKPMYRFVNSIRQYEANGTVNGDGGWKAQVATYRLLPDLCAIVTCDDGNPCTADTCDPTTGLCDHTPQSAGTSCGDRSNGICDAPDTCDGAGTCQSNHVADGTTCGEVNSDCEYPDTCQSGICHDNGFKAAGTGCGDPSSGQCDAADACNGSGLCQSNHDADGAACGDAGTECTNQDTCVSGACLDNGFKSAGTACGDPSSGVCDAADSCNDLGLCASNHTANGTPCDDDEACTTGDACNTGQCVGNSDEQCLACIGNTAPIVSPSVAADPSDPAPLGSGTFTLSASFTDTPGQIHSCAIDWDDGSEPDAGSVLEPTATEAGGCTGSHLYTGVGVYTVTVTITDPCGETAGAIYRYAVVYDASAGFVTGGGWIQSPEGAYTPNPSLTGKAHFGFESRYTKGNSNAPIGVTHFHFSVANFDFESNSYDWLVISGSKARFKGTGKVNGGGNYGFEIVAWDGQIPGGGDVDRFRITIRDLDHGDDVVYDNQLNAPGGADPTTVLGGGSIVIHKK